MKVYSKRDYAFDVTIYTQPDCAFCERAKAWLRSRGVPFTERDPRKDPAAIEEVERLALGNAPAIVVDGQVFTEFDPAALEAALTSKRPRSSEEREAAEDDQGP
jgi:glutaredoxin-like protein NrdH